jgi:hypothetical protein
MSPRASRLLWRASLAGFLALALWPIWAHRFPPMQDYPQHLFHSHLLAAQGDARFDYDRYYELHLQPVYALFYVLTVGFSKLVPIEAAGKLTLSLYPLLVAVLVLRLRRRFPDDAPPWAALLLFPLAPNQQWFFGNVNFFLSVPLLFLALLDFEDLLAKGASVRGILRQVAWQAALFVTHPLTFLAFVAIAVFVTFARRRKVERAWRRLAGPLSVSAALLVGFLLQSMLSRAPPVPADPRVGWLPPWMSLQYIGLMFTGMRPPGSRVLLDVLPWAGVVAILAACAFVQRRTAPGTGAPSEYLWLLAIALVATLVLPFSKGVFSFINVRIASIVYVLLALVAAHVRARGIAAALLVALAAVCSLRSNAKQATISAETEEIVGVLERIPQRARILPLVFDNTSPELDPTWFHPHLLDASYYHVLVGGGFDPYLIRSPIHPVHFREGAKRPAPGEFWAGAFDWKAHGADYEYFLVRGAPEGFSRVMELRATRIGTSGRWEVYKRRSSAARTFRRCRHGDHVTRPVWVALYVDPDGQPPSTIGSR